MSPTYEASQRFLREFVKLSPSQRQAFLKARDELVDSLRSRPPSFAPRLRVKRVQGTDDVWEISWAADGRATFRYGEPERPDEPHVVWLRVGSHAILDDPAG